MNTDNEIGGVIAAVPTPYTTSGKPDIELFLEHCNWALANGCNALNILGTTGEANSLDTDCRVQIMSAAAKSTLPPNRLMVGTGTPSLAETVRLTKLAANLGYAAALILPPYYYKPISDDGLFAYFSDVINSVRDKNIGIYLYNFPQMTGISFSTGLVSRLISAFPVHIKGMKDSSGDLDYAREMAAAFSENFDVFPSNEATLQSASVDGFAGCISASVNVTGPLAARVWRKAAGVGHGECQNMIKLRKDISSIPIVQAVKALISIREKNPSWRYVKPPLMGLTSEQKVKLETIADMLGYS